MNTLEPMYTQSQMMQAISFITTVVGHTTRYLEDDNWSYEENITPERIAIEIQCENDLVDDVTSGLRGNMGDIDITTRIMVEGEGNYGDSSDTLITVTRNWVKD